MTDPGGQEEGTWTDEDPASGPQGAAPLVGQSGLIEARDLARRKHEHRASMQMRVLLGVFLVFAFALVSIVVAAATHRISEQFAMELARMILPAVLGSGATIVGALFISGREASG